MSNDLQSALVNRLKEGGAIQSRAVENAFLAVPRHLFVPGIDPERAYADVVIPIKQNAAGETISSSSQPAIMAIMLEQLNLRPGQNVLEIGTGTGYNAALMAHIVGRRGQVTSLDIDPDLSENAREHLKAAGVENVKCITADGAAGYPSDAPYDRIILTVSATDISPAWREQLGNRGRLVMPLILGSRQVATALEPVDGVLQSLTLTPCGFMPLRGAFAPANEIVRYEVMPGVEASVNHHIPTDAPQIRQWLTGSYEDISTVLNLNALAANGSALWMELHEPNHIALAAVGEAANSGIVPYLYGRRDNHCTTTGVISEDGLALLMRPPGTPLPEKSDWESRFVVHIRRYGDDKALVQTLVDHLSAWDSLQQPSTRNMTIRVFPRNSEYETLPGEVVIPRAWNDFVIRWSRQGG